jgi:hypothetical protein
MKKNNQKSIIDELREIRDKISNDIKNMQFEQLKEYFEKEKAIHPVMRKKQSIKKR